MQYNPYLIIPLAAWLIAQTLKFAIAAMRGEINFRYLYASGGMPSVHSAVVCSLAVTAFLVDGPSSHLFGFALLFAVVVMYDSFGVRRSAGEQAVAINMIMQSLERDRIKLSDPDLKLREILGHKPVEVTAGALLGIFLGLLFNIGLLSSQINFVLALPSRFEFTAFAGLAGTLVIGGLVARLLLRFLGKESKVLQKLGTDVLLLTQTVGWLGVLASFGQYQHLQYVSYRLWSWLLLAAALAWMGWLVAKYWQTLPAERARETEASRKGKWLHRTGKKRK
jgi:acid phosphatase family membrane protein YuiD